VLGGKAPHRRVFLLPDRVRARSTSDTAASNAVGSHASTIGFKSNTSVPLSISRCSRKNPIPNIKPIAVRAPAPADRNDPSTNGIGSSTANAIATVRAMRDQNANTYGRASSAFAW
jgi:hypothetical protein